MCEGLVYNLVRTVVMDTYQVEVILYKIVLEVLQRKSPISQSLHKGMMRKSVPNGSHIRSVEDVVDELTTRKLSEPMPSLSHGSIEEGELTAQKAYYIANESG